MRQTRKRVFRIAPKCPTQNHRCPNGVVYGVKTLTTKMRSGRTAIKLRSVNTPHYFHVFLLTPAMVGFILIYSSIEDCQLLLPQPSLYTFLPPLIINSRSIFIGNGGDEQQRKASEQPMMNSFPSMSLLLPIIIRHPIRSRISRARAKPGRPWEWRIVTDAPLTKV